MNNYSNEQKAIFGSKFADILGIKFDRRSGKYITGWGLKSSIGIYEMCCTFSEAIKNGEEDDL
jgi:hypothetical protein